MNKNLILIFTKSRTRKESKNSFSCLYRKQNAEIYIQLLEHTKKVALKRLTINKYCTLKKSIMQTCGVKLIPKKLQVGSDLGTRMH
jgi:hypothetical protein